MKKLTKEQEERIEKFWDRGVVYGLYTSTAPQYIIEHTLFSIASLEDENEFLEKSKELGVLKNEFSITCCRFASARHEVAQMCC